MPTPTKLPKSGLFLLNRPGKVISNSRSKTLETVHIESCILNPVSRFTVQYRILHPVSCLLHLEFCILNPVPPHIGGKP
jgi:hypothetical protein